MHRLSVKFANICIARRWIQAQDEPWCIYAIEKKLLTVPFFLFLTIISIILKIFPQTAIFTCVFYSLRRRFGGWHAPYAWLCQIISTALVLEVDFVLGPAILALPTSAVLCMDSGVMVTAWMRKPVYPIQTHFTDEIIVANNKKKNHIVLAVVVLQISFGLFYREALIYSLLAVLTGVISVYIEIMQQYINRRKGEES